MKDESLVLVVYIGLSMNYLLVATLKCSHRFVYQDELLWRRPTTIAKIMVAFYAKIHFFHMISADQSDVFILLSSSGSYWWCQWVGALKDPHILSASPRKWRFQVKCGRSICKKLARFARQKRTPPCWILWHPTCACNRPIYILGGGPEVLVVAPSKI
jgi:hypothetical protein